MFQKAASLTRIILTLAVPLFFLLLFYYTRPNYDETALFVKIKANGFLSTLQQINNTWTLRLFSFSIVGLLIKISQTPQQYFFLTFLVSAAVFVFSTLTINQLVTSVINPQSGLLKFYYSFLFQAGLYFFCLSPAEIYGWFPSLFLYYLPLMCLVRIMLVFNAGPLTFFEALFYALIIATGAELVSVTAIAVCAWWILRANKTGAPAALYVFMGLLLALSVTAYLQPGVWQRGITETRNVEGGLLQSLQTMFALQNNYYVLFGILLAALIGASLVRPLPRSLPGILLIATVFIYGISLLLTHFVFHGTLVRRLWFMANACNFLWFIYGASQLHQRHRNLIQKSAPLCTLLFLAYSLVQEIKLKTFANNYDRALKEICVANAIHDQKQPDPGITSATFPNGKDSVFIKFSCKR